MAHLETDIHSATTLLEKSDPEVLQGRNPYELPASVLTKIEESENAELKAYVYVNTDYYLSQWENRSYRFNWAAFLLPELWMLYRKMYWQFLAFSGAIVVLSFVVETLLPMSLGWVTRLGPMLICGFFGNKWYHSHALLVIRKARSKEFQADRRIELLYKRGKKRPIVLFVLIVALFITILITEFWLSSITYFLLQF